MPYLGRRIRMVGIDDIILLHRDWRQMVLKAPVIRCAYTRYCSELVIRHSLQGLANYVVDLEPNALMSVGDFYYNQLQRGQPLLKRRQPKHASHALPK